MIHVGITTAPRPKEHYLTPTLASLEAAGFAPPYHIFAEPDTPWANGTATRHVLYQRDVKFGEYHNWIDALRPMATLSASPGPILMVQDDVTFCCNVRPWLEQALWPSESCGAIQVYTSRRYRAHKDFPRGLSKLPKRFVRDLNAACAIVFRPETVDGILDYAEHYPWKGRRRTSDNPADVQELDAFIGTAIAELDYEIWCCNPSLGYHIGETSALNHGGSVGARQALEFPGEEADAFKVLGSARAIA